MVIMVVCLVGMFWVKLVVSVVGGRLVKLVLFIDSLVMFGGIGRFLLRLFVVWLVFGVKVVI